MKEEVILVNERDEPQGLMEKMEAHEKGLLHRAFSVFVFNDKNQLLLQQRALSKYHSGGLWTNTCCSHPRSQETVLEAAHRHLQEEMGFDCDLKKLTDFVYRAELDKGLIEHEFDHVFFGQSNQVSELNLEEVEDFRYIALNDLELEIKEAPQNFTP